MTALPLPAAAAALRVSDRTLRRWLREGAPTASPGARGRGRLALIDPQAVAAWRACHAVEAAPTRADVARALAGELPALVADAVADAHRAIQGPHKRACGPALVATWYAVTLALLDRLRRDAPDLGDPDVVPEKMRHLASDFGRSR